ncbi:radical SAM protein, partial [bacterium]|nr:radical SAM protein [Candidatus Elulimicrobium humile]
DIISTNLSEALAYTDYAKKNNKSITVLFETTRGCPYGCTYCEWSGGINSKVIDRDLKQIENELSYFPLIEVESVYLTDANFGIMKTDPAKAEMLAGIKHYYKNFRVEISGLAKTGPEKRLAVLEPLFASGALLSYQMSIQTGSREALKHVSRTDLTVEENVEMARYLSKKYDATIHMEYILGLPGYTLNDFYDEYDAIYESASGLLANYGGVSRGPLMILPDSPAANPEYIKKHGLKLVPIGIEASDGEIGYDQIYNVILDPNFVDEPSTFIPVQANTYSEDEWKQMLFMGDIDHIFRISGIFELLVIFLYFRRGIKPSEIFKKIYSALVKVKGLYEPAERYADMITSGKLSKYDWRLMEAEKGFYANVYVCYLYLWVKHIDEIYANLEKELEGYLDEQTMDCINYLRNTTFRFSGEVEWTSKWDWSSWEYLKEKNEGPALVPMTYVTK